MVAKLFKIYFIFLFISSLEASIFNANNLNSKDQEYFVSYEVAPSQESLFTFKILNKIQSKIQSNDPQNNTSFNKAYPFLSSYWAYSYDAKDKIQPYKAMAVLNVVQARKWFEIAVHEKNSNGYFLLSQDHDLKDLSGQFYTRIQKALLQQNIPLEAIRDEVCGVHGVDGSVEMPWNQTDDEKSPELNLTLECTVFYQNQFGIEENLSFLWSLHFSYNRDLQKNVKVFLKKERFDQYVERPLPPNVDVLAVVERELHLQNTALRNAGNFSFNIQLQMDTLYESLSEENLLGLRSYEAKLNDYYRAHKENKNIKVVLRK